jgi:hypothetical protein
MLIVVNFQMMITVASLCLHDMIAHVKGEDLYVHYEWEEHAFDVLYDGLNALWCDGAAHRWSTITTMCAGVTTWLLLDVISGVYVSLTEYTLVGSPELLVIVLSLMSLMASVPFGEHLTYGHEDQANACGEQGARCGHHNGLLKVR